MALYNKKHGLTDSPTYISWNCARKRVREGKGNYKNISMDPRWYNDFNEFYRDMGERPEGTTLDRIDPRGNYCKENCRWADRYTQDNNKTSNVYYIVNNKKMTIAEAARIIGIRYQTLWNYIHARGQSLEEILRRRGFQC